MWAGLVAAMPFFTNKIKLKTKKTILYNPDYREGIALYKEYLDEIEIIVLDNKVLEQAVMSNIKFKKYELEEWKEKTKIINNAFQRSENINQYSKIKNSFYICLYYNDCITDLLMYLKDIFPRLHEQYSDITVHLYNFEILENSKKIPADILETIKSKEYYIIHRGKTYTEITQDKYQYQYQLYLYSSFGASHLSVCDLRHSLFVNCIPIISKNIYMMLTEFKCLIYSTPPPFKIETLLSLMTTICEYTPIERQLIEEHNQNVFEKNNFQKNWAEEILKLSK